MNINELISERFKIRMELSKVTSEEARAALILKLKDLEEKINKIKK